jgi:predicted Zn-dependent peptidase
LRILATSREALGVAGERLYPVRSLTLPDVITGTTDELAARYEAVGLFLERARAAESVQLARELLGETADKLTQPELDRARAQIEAGLLMTLETPQGRADHMARSIEVFGRILSLDELLDHIRAVTIENARAVGRALLDGPVAVASVGAALALAA